MKLFSRLSTFTLIFAMAVEIGSAQTQHDTATPISMPKPHQHLVCNAGYSPQRCDEQMRTLKPVLDAYGADALGDWTWILVQSDVWKPIKDKRGMDPNSPAFSVLEKHETFIEEALVAPVPARRAELIKQWSSSIDDLLKLAVTHELGHALCNEHNEAKADNYGRLLRAGKPVNCR